jgi:hypothetical protein
MAGIVGVASSVRVPPAPWRRLSPGAGAAAAPGPDHELELTRLSSHLIRH